MDNLLMNDYFYYELLFLRLIKKEKKGLTSVGSSYNSDRYF